MTETKRDPSQLDETDLDAITGGAGVQMPISEQFKGLPIKSMIGEPLTGALEFSNHASKWPEEYLDSLRQKP